MKSTMRATLVLSLLLASTGCTVFGGKKAVVIAPNAECPELVPDRWKQGVEHAPEPAPAPPAPVAPAANAPEPAKTAYWKSMYDWAMGELKSWTNYGVAETQKVEDANGRTADSMSIVEECEKRNSAAIKRAAK